MAIQEKSPSASKLKANEAVQPVRRGDDIQIAACPQCGAPAELTDYGTATSTAGPVDIVRVMCASRHWFLMTRDALEQP